MWHVKVRAAGCADFDATAEPSATVADFKIAATAGCDIDPQVMKIIFKGKILKDEDVLGGVGVKDGETLHIARGKPATSAAATVPSTEAVASPGASSVAAPADLRAKVSLKLKGLGGLDLELEGLTTSTSVADVRTLAGKHTGFRASELHLMHKAKFLKDEECLGACGLKDGDVLRVARRPHQSGAAPTVPAASSQAGPTEPWEGAAMPMAWGGQVDFAQQAQQIGQVMFGRNFDAAALGPEQMAELQEMQQMLQRGDGAGPRRGAPGMIPEDPNNFQARLAAEVQTMQFAVRQLLREQRDGPGSHRPPPQGRPLREAPEAENEEDAELLNDIAQTMAECRARGAPVPQARAFVDRAVRRGLARRQRWTQMRRDGEGLDPELEDAVMAAESSAAAAERAPRRLGGGGGPVGPGRPQQ